MNSRTRLIRAWLLKMPRAHTVRVHSGDDVHLVEVGLAKWAAIATTIDALDPELIECLGPEQNLLRAVRIDQLDESEEPADDTSSSSSSSAMDQRRTDREMQLLTRFGELLAEAYKHSTTTAFVKMVELFEAVAKRGESLEKSLATTERLLRKAYADGAGASEEGEQSLLEQMLSAYVSGQHNSAIENAMAGAVKGSKPNGKSTNQI